MNQDLIAIRKFPFPYQAALAISSDVDNTPSIKIYLDMMNYLNGAAETPFGCGLNLEVGNSFWFFNHTNSKQICYFENDSNRETPFAPYCRALINSGHIDTLHTYGNFDEGGFTRKHAEKAISELDKYNLSLKTWVNHGTSLNTQNIGLTESLHGAIQESDSYHFDLLLKHGLRYAWTGRMTHILGQETVATLNVKLKNLIQSKIFDIKYKKYKEQIFDIENRLMIKRTLQDGNEIWDFIRFVNTWGREKLLDVYDFAKQIQPKNINRLVSNQGFLIVYTHFCEGLNEHQQIPKRLREALAHISTLCNKKRLLLTTTTRLLQYHEIINHLKWNVLFESDRIKIIVSPNVNILNRDLRISADLLQGLTFYCPTNKNIEISLDNRSIMFQKNSIDYTGKTSISIPWIPLKYPYLDY